MRSPTETASNKQKYFNNYFIKRILPSANLRRDLDVPRAYLDRSCPRLSAYVGDALLSI